MKHFFTLIFYRKISLDLKIQVFQPLVMESSLIWWTYSPSPKDNNDEIQLFPGLGEKWKANRKCTGVYPWKMNTNGKCLWLFGLLPKRTPLFVHNLASENQQTCKLEASKDWVKGNKRVSSLGGEIIEWTVTGELSSRISPKNWLLLLLFFAFGFFLGSTCEIRWYLSFSASFT